MDRFRGGAVRVTCGLLHPSSLRTAHARSRPYRVCTHRPVHVPRPRGGTAEFGRKGDEAAAEVATYASCCGIIYRLAKDQVFGGTSASDYIDQELGGRLRPVLQTCSRELDTALARFDRSRAKSNVTLACELAQARDSAAGRSVTVAVDVGYSDDLDAHRRTQDSIRIASTKVARKITRTVSAEDLPRLVLYAERADTPKTRALLLQAYEREGRSLFERIPPKLVPAGGVTTAMIYGTHRATAPMAALGTQIGNNPDLAERTLDWMAIIGGAVVLVITTTFLWWLGPFRRRQPAAAPTTTLGPPQPRI